jgi:cytochrome P450
LIQRAAEELLRRRSIAIPNREVSRDAVFKGITFKKGEVVFLAFPAANRDPQYFQDPEQIQLDRSESNLSFGAGPHRCVGAHLARIELKVLYQELLKRIPLFSLDDDVPCRFHSGQVLAIDSLPLVW